MIKNCFYCKEEIIKQPNDSEYYYMMIPIDNPYINMFMHLPCYQSFLNWNLVMDHIINNFDDIWKYYMDIVYSPKKSKKKNGISEETDNE